MSAGIENKGEFRSEEEKEAAQEFEGDNRISVEVFELAGYKIGDIVSIERNGKVVDGYRIDHFTTIETMGHKEPAAVVIGDQHASTERLFHLNVANPTEEFKESIKK